MGYQIVFSLQAQRDLRNIERYISRDSPQVAERFGQKLLKKASMLEIHPEIGRVFPELGDRTIREIIVGNYRVIYKVDFLKKQIKIARYWHAARGIPDIRF